MVNIYVRHSSSGSSSWERLFREITFYQESTHEIIETFVSSNWATDQGSDRNYEHSTDRLAAANVAKGQPCLLTRQLVHFATAKSCLFRFSAVSGRHQFRSRRSLEGQD